MASAVQPYFAAFAMETLADGVPDKTISTFRSGTGFTEFGESLIVAAEEVVRARALGGTPSVDNVMYRLKPHMKLLERKTGVQVGPENIEHVLNSYDRKLQRLAAANGRPVESLAMDLHPHLRGLISGKPIPDSILDLTIPIGPVP